MKTLPGKEKQWIQPWIAGAKPEETDKVAALKPAAFLLYLLWASLVAWALLSFSFSFFFFPSLDGINFLKPVLKEEC